ncbi:unnamed protein product [Phytophthora fragariaefolia]|uniref:Unnamed protein product n=1 Tax=Phytophthora fragariaefolia TaxID=1490495 RepID=A0A9W7CW27_9STRA|nr:unnamed protein product [Phytophthora fragariaefolia]
MAQIEPPWEQAVAAVLTGMSIRKVARTFPGLEREALRRRIHGLVPMHAQRGRCPVFLSSGHEQGILEVVAARSHMGFCIEDPELRYIIRQCALSNKPAGGVPPGFPNKWWVQRFVKRHKKELSWRKPQILDQKRADHSTEEIVRGYARRLEPVLCGVAAECIWNCDETGVCAQGTVKTRVLCSRGLAANTRRSRDRENVTMMGCVNAAGGSIPPMYIFAGEHRKVAWLDEAVPGAVCAMTESSNVNGNVFLYWLKFFVCKIDDVRPQVLVMDGHFSHLSRPAVEFAIANGVKLFLLPSHTSHFLQPLDVSIFRTFKECFNVAVKAFPRRKGLGDAALPTRGDIPALTRLPFLKAFSPKRICRGFAKTGISPFNANIMLDMMVGSISSQHTKQLPHYAALETAAFDLQLTDRQR